MRGDLLLYAGVVPASGRVIADLPAQGEAGRRLRLQLDAPTESIHEVHFGRLPCPDVLLESARIVEATVPEEIAALPLGDLIKRFVPRVWTVPNFERHFLAGPSSKADFSSRVVSGVGLSPRLDVGPSEALQRVLRFLLMTDPMNPRRGGGLGHLAGRYVGGRLEDSRRVIEVACDVYNRYPHPRTQGWHVRRVTLRSLEEVVPQDLEPDLLSLNVSDPQAGLVLVVILGLDFQGPAGSFPSSARLSL